MVLRVVNMLCIVALFSSSNIWALANTKGSPLGGMGTGYLKFDATTGQIAAVTKVMPAASEGMSEFANHTSSSCGLHFFVNNGGTVASQPKATTLNESAVIPVYAATFAPVGGVTFIDTSYGPIISGAAYDKITHSPMAFFDVTAINANATDCEVAVALEFSNISTQGKNLLGGADVGASDGENAISWAGDQTIGSGYMMAGCETNTATFSSGAMGTFTTTGTLTAGAGNIVSAKCVIPAGSSTRFRFVISWWNRWILTPPNTVKPGEEDHWYHNYYPTGAKEVATFGMENYELIRAGATGIVKRTMASNFPEWYKERLLNNLYPLIHNSVSAKDGRTGYWEGQYAIIGTIDQNEHAGLWYVFNWPQNQWRELQFWARSSHKADEGNLLGQIHHDFNGTTSLSTWAYDNSDINRFLYPWDNSTHDDYSYSPNTTDWMDLNCMFIFKAYELMLATGDRDSLTIYWPYIKNTANRIIVYCTPGTKLPHQSLSSYDSPNSQNYTYPSALSLSAWYAVAEMAKWLGETETEDKYREQYTAAREEFATTYAAQNDFGNAGDQNHPEGDVAGYSWARYFGFPANIDSMFIVRGCSNLWNKYSGLTNQARLGLWHFYQFDHFGGALTAIAEPDKALEVHQWDYEYFHAASPAFVHWQDLWDANNVYRSYGTAPTVWRSLFQFSGMLVDNANNRLWCRPQIPTSMNKTLINVPIVNPIGWGTLNYNENPVATSAGTRVQSIAIQFDSSVTVKELVLKNNTTVADPGILIWHNNAVVEGATSVLEGSGFEKNIRITLAAPIQVGPDGLNVKVYEGAVPAEDLSVHHTARKVGYALSLTGGQLESGRTISFSVPVTGKVTLDLFQVNGAKIGTLANGSLSAGSHTILWKGITAHGSKVPTNMAILRLTCSSGSIAKTVYIKK
ncbi:MAG: hypothetical protein JW863_08010 [Chitinispirillaceae bacterium]|nr:hypothetical protein [Chitinispirillaceae bacterium]